MENGIYRYRFSSPRSAGHLQSPKLQLRYPRRPLTLPLPKEKMAELEPEISRIEKKIQEGTSFSSNDDGESSENDRTSSEGEDEGVGEWTDDESEGEPAIGAEEVPKEQRTDEERGLEVVPPRGRPYV
ncbi:hypothetical protein L207DRAFT_575735 [Hyaloscypha variabilis F]|uniref:Uncharacterized protein n=1 Tax=Hyaloscypha variabilis (strain UAMH 11265 / GT02V1 / F) TaxID=1149755 RepID=A0A2J6SEB0_HYAVF|nr:hypothetical protein L207DRAFT_575735 [Hyaloscypha variabilis F]